MTTVPIPYSIPLRLSVKPLLVTGLIVLCVGCGDDTSIRSYTVAKGSSSNSAIPQVATEAKPAQILGMIVPHEESAWFLKLTDAPDRVQQLRDDFMQLARSLSFSDDGTPQWELANGWTEQVMKQITYARFSHADGGTVTLTQLGANTKESDQWQRYLIDNINRWRQQLSLSPADWTAIETDLEEAPSHSTETAKAYFVSLTGKQAPGSSMGMGAAPFANQAQRPQGAESGSKPAQTSSTVDNPHGDTSAAEITATTTSPRRQLTYQVPDGWQEQPSSGIRLAYFEIPGEPSPATVSISTAGGAIEQSIGMWFQQVGGSPEASQIDAVVEKALTNQVKLGEYTCYEIENNDAEAHSPAIRVAVLPLNEQESLFIKLTGAKQQIETLAESMDQLIASLDWK